MDQGKTQKRPRWTFPDEFKRARCGWKSRPARKRKHPLADRDVRQDAVDQVSGCPLHPPRGAGWADSAALAGEGDERLVAHTRRTARGRSRRRECRSAGCVQTRRDDARQAAAVVALFRLREEGAQMLADGLVKGHASAFLASCPWCRS